jgi:hypothetical protein
MQEAARTGRVLSTRLKQRLGISMLPVLTPDAAGLALDMAF